MVLRLLVGLMVLASIALAFAAPPCTLSDNDYAALGSAVAGPLDRAAVEALNGKDAANLCKARAFVAKVRLFAGGATKLSDKQADEIAAKIGDKEIAPGTKKYVTAEEWDFISPVIVVVLARMSAGKFAPN